jgi:hypothetical protein
MPQVPGCAAVASSSGRSGSIPDWISSPGERGETCLPKVEGEVAGTVTLTTWDPAWSDESDATSAHRLAVHRAVAGLGHDLLKWVSAEARRRFSSARLDCASSNVRPRRYYTDAGFSARGEAIVHDTQVALFERLTGLDRRNAIRGQPPELSP